MEICDTFNLFKRLEFWLPIIPEVGASSTKLKNVVRATPPVPASSRRKAEPAHLDFALIRTAEQNNRTAGSTLQGLRVGQVRVIFKLPDVYRVTTTHPLAYVEWFTPFGAHVHAPSDLHAVTRSTRMHHRYAEIVEVDRIVRNCHLIPKFGRVIDLNWTSDNVIELCKTFYMNHYIDYHFFVMLKARLTGCISM
ncbi:hypothetical protein HWV62_19333 [Athelia sp. TMB]|nr:hypothetical protein HWV62_19333 [Athelia sp. TMB]